MRKRVDRFENIYYYNDEGLLHREDGPAIEYSNGEKHWYKNNLRHRDDGPAIEYPNGAKYWYKNGLIHRDDGPAIEYENGTKKWLKNGQFHREDGPAIEYSFYLDQYWYEDSYLKECDSVEYLKKWIKLKVFR
jgi:hypothetical protein